MLKTIKVGMIYNNFNFYRINFNYYSKDILKIMEKLYDLE